MCGTHANLYVTIFSILYVVQLPLFIYRYIKTSSLTLSLASIVGCGMVLLSAIPALLTFGAEHYEIDETQFNTLCQVRLSCHYMFHCLIQGGSLSISSLNVTHTPALTACNPYHKPCMIQEFPFFNFL